MDFGNLLRDELVMYLNSVFPSLMQFIVYAVPVAGSIIVIGVVIKAFKKAVR